MTRLEAVEILEYVAEKLISPLCFSDKSAKDAYLDLSGKTFNDLCAFVYTMVEKED